MSRVTRITILLLITIVFFLTIKNYWFYAKDYLKAYKYSKGNSSLIVYKNIQDQQFYSDAQNAMQKFKPEQVIYAKFTKVKDDPLNLSALEIQLNYFAYPNVIKIIASTDLNKSTLSKCRLLITDMPLDDTTQLNLGIKGQIHKIDKELVRINRKFDTSYFIYLL